MNVRNVRLLDRAHGQPADDQTRFVEGVRVDRSIPIPAPRAQATSVTAVLNALEVGESFIHGYRLKMKKLDPGKKFTLHKQPNGKYRIWRVA